jgi:hypothetical protein
LLLVLPFALISVLGWLAAKIKERDQNS